MNLVAIYTQMEKWIIWGFLCVYRGVEQMVARQVHTLKAVGSSPTPAIKIILNLPLQADIGSLRFSPPIKRKWTLQKFCMIVSSSVNS